MNSRKGANKADMEDWKKERMQAQLRQFLKDYRNLNELTAEQAAEALEVEIATYRALEGNKAGNRVISSLEYLDKLASLKELTLTQFVSLLERSGRVESGNGKGALKRDLYKWEMDVLRHFDKIGIPLRNRFLAAIESIPSTEFRDLLSAITKILKLSENTRSALLNLIEQVGSDAK